MKSQTKKSSAKPNMEVVRAVAQRVEIQQVKLIESTLKCAPSFPKPPRNVEIGCGSSVDYNKEKERVLVAVRFKLSARHEDSTSHVPDDVQIEALFLIVYHLKPGPSLTRDQLAKFAELNGIFNAWPYWREYVQSTTSRMGLPPLVMPSFKVGADDDAVK